MIDRFGLLPEPTKALFAVTELKLKVRSYGIKKIEAGPKGGRIVFGEQPNIDHTKLIYTQSTSVFGTAERRVG